MSTITEFDFRTGGHSYPDGAIWSEQDGPGPSTYYRNDRGSKIELRKAQAVLDCCRPWAEEERRRVRAGEFDA